jgi:hypothetical protein
LVFPILLGGPFLGIQKAFDIGCGMELNEISGLKDIDVIELSSETGIL